jgi:hypothetical protein
LADYRQVKPWKKRDIAEEIVRLENGGWQKGAKTLKQGGTEATEE